MMIEQEKPWMIEIEGNKLKVILNLGESSKFWEVKSEEELRAFMKEARASILGHRELEERLSDFRRELEEKWKEVNEPKPIVLDHLTDIEEPSLSGRNIIVDAVIASTSIPYTIPKRYRVTTFENDEILENELEIPERSEYVLQLVGITEARKQSILAQYAGVRRGSRIEVLEWRTVYKVRVRPVVFFLEKKDSKIVDERGREYKYFDIYIIAEKKLSLEPGTIVRLHSIILPDPRTQKVTLLVYKVEFPDNVESFNKENIRKLMKKFEGWSIREKVDWILNETEKGSGIIDRRDVALTYYLDAFTPLWLELEGKIQRGWGISSILGDTTAGKSALGRWIIRLLKAGLIITAELASLAGLAGTARQLSDSDWFVDWGLLPLNHRKWVIIDGAHKLSKEAYAALAETERDGTVVITKAGKGVAPAQVRITKIFNPRNPENYNETKHLKEFYRPVQALATVLDRVSIARLDRCVFVDSRDVSPEEVNQPRNGDYDRDLDLLADVRGWVWSGLPKVVFDDDAWNEILRKATEMYNSYYCDPIPLASIDLKYKLARMSAALAFLTLSVNADLTEVRVTKEHVDFIVQWLKSIYDKAELKIFAQETRDTGIDEEEAGMIIRRIAEAIDRDIEKAIEILRFIVARSNSGNPITKDQLKQNFSLADNNQLRPLITELRNHDLVIQRRGFYPTPKLISLVKLLDTQYTSTINQEDEGQQVSVDSSSSAYPVYHVYHGETSIPPLENEVSGPTGPTIQCPHCGSEFVTVIDLKNHIESNHDRFDPVLAGLIAWERDSERMLEMMLRRKGRKIRIGEVTWLLEKMNEYKERNDLQGWIDFVYALPVDEAVDAEDAGNELVSVRFKKYVDKFVGIDMRIYGPFNAGDTARIPRENAEAFAQREAVEIIRGGDQ